MSKPRYLRIGRREGEGNDDPPSYVPRTEHEEVRRAARDWLRERTEDDVIEFDDEPEFGF